MPPGVAGVIAGNSLPRAAAAIGLLLLCIIPVTVGQTNPAASESTPPPGIQVRINATPQIATIGDPIRLGLEITMPAGYQAEIVKIDKQLGDFSIFEFAPGTVEPEPGKTKKAAPIPSQTGAPVTHRAHIVAAAYRTGVLIFPPVQMRLLAPDGKQFTVASPPVQIEIRSVLSEKDKDLKDLKKQAEMPERARWGLWLGILAAIGIIAFLAWLLWKRRHRRAPSIPAAPPRDLLDVAEAELRELLARGFPAEGMVKPFYVRLSDIVKRILEAGYGIHTAEQTTSEIMDGIENVPGRAAEDMARIQTFLGRCDLVKFAKYVPSAAEHKSAASGALEILEISRRLVVRRQSPIVNGATTADCPLPAAD